MTDEHPAETLTECEAGDVLRLTMEDGETYTVHLVDAVQHAPPDYSKGSVSVSIELDTDEHAVPEDFPTCSGHLRARTRSSLRTSAWEDLTLSLWDPVVDESGHVEEDEWRTLGTVSSLEIAED